MDTTIEGNGWKAIITDKVARFKYHSEIYTVTETDLPKGKSMSDLRIHCAKHRNLTLAEHINDLNHWFEKN